MAHTLGLQLCKSCAGTENYHQPDCPQQQANRLRAVNADLLAALEACRNEILRTAVLYGDKIRTEMNPVHMADAAIKAAKSSD